MAILVNKVLAFVNKKEYTTVMKKVLKNAFTLIELLVVIAIFAIVASMVVAIV
jgi:prepilin-type N-terminal cleavage/methylation domain-containing protein